PRIGGRRARSRRRAPRRGEGAGAARVQRSRRANRVVRDSSRGRAWGRGDQHQPDGAEPRDIVRGSHREETRLTAATHAGPAPRTAAHTEPRQVSVTTVFVALLRRDIRVASKELPFFLIRT